MPAQRVSDVANDAWRVFSFKPNVKRAFAVFNRAQSRGLRVDRWLKVRREIRKPQRARQIDQVSDNRARGRHLTRSGTDEHHFTDGAPAYEDRVAGALDRGKQVMERHQHWMSAHIETPVASPREPDHLDPISELFCHRDVEVGYPGDTLAVNEIRVNELSKRERRQDGYFVSNVESLDVVGRISLGESKALGLRQRVVKTLAAVFHCGKDVISGAVQDSRDARYFVRLKSALNSRDQRYAAPNRRFKQHGDVVAVGKQEDLRAMT